MICSRYNHTLVRRLVTIAFHFVSTFIVLLEIFVSRAFLSFRKVCNSLPDSHSVNGDKN